MINISLYFQKKKPPQREVVKIAMKKMWSCTPHNSVNILKNFLKFFKRVTLLAQTPPLINPNHKTPTHS